MEETQTTSATSSRKFSLTSISFLVGVLLFLLPFVEIKCNGQTFATNTGIGLALGIDYKTTAQTKSLENPFGETSEKKVVEKEKGKLYVFALIALILGIVGLIISLASAKPGKALVFIGSLTAISLIVLMIQIQMDVKEKPVSGGENNLSNDLKVTAEFTAWYYLSLLSFILAAALSYRRKPVVL
jgi:amino acid transporter